MRNFLLLDATSGKMIDATSRLIDATSLEQELGNA